MTISFRSPEQLMVSTGIAVPTFSILFWNTAYKDHINTELISLEQKREPDIVALVEFGKTTKEDLQAYAEALPGYKTTKIGHSMACWTRGDIELQEVVRMPNRSAYAKGSLRQGRYQSCLSSTLARTRSIPAALG